MGPLPLLFGELDGAEFVDDTPESEPYVPAVDPVVEEFFLDGEEAEVSLPKTAERIPAVDPRGDACEETRAAEEATAASAAGSGRRSDSRRLLRSRSRASRRIRSRSFRRLHKKVKKERFRNRSMIEWVSANLDEPVEDIHPRHSVSGGVLAAPHGGRRRRLAPILWTSIGRRSFQARLS